MATWAMRKRYEWIEARLGAGEPFTRQDLVDAFTITTQTASATLNQFRELHPGVLAYDAAVRRFLRPDQAAAHGLTKLERQLLAALKEARDALRRVAAERRAIGPIATHAQQAAWASSMVIDEAEGQS